MANNTFNNQSATGSRTKRQVRTAMAAAVLLIACGAISPLHAEGPERYYDSCLAQALAGVNIASCDLQVPAGKHLVITSVTAIGTLPSSQSVMVRLSTFINGSLRYHHFQAGFQVLSSGWSVWNGAIPGTIWSEGGTMRFWFSRAGNGNTANFQVAVSGYFE